MKILLKTFDDKEYEKEISEENYEVLKEGLKSSKIGFIEIENILIKSSQIVSIKPTGETIPKSFRLESPKFEKVGNTETMEATFNLLKSKGLFKDYKSYQEYCGRNI